MADNNNEYTLVFDGEFKGQGPLDSGGTELARAQEVK